MAMNLSKLWEIMEEKIAWHAAFCGVTKNRSDLTTEQQDKALFSYVTLIREVKH